MATANCFVLPFTCLCLAVPCCDIEFRNHLGDMVEHLWCEPFWSHLIRYKHYSSVSNHLQGKKTKPAEIPLLA